MGTTTFPFESSTRKGPEAETTAPPAPGAGRAGTPPAAGLAVLESADATVGFAAPADGVPGGPAPPAGALASPDGGPGAVVGRGGAAGGPGGAPVSMATRTTAGSLAAATLVGWIPA